MAETAGWGEWNTSRMVFGWIAPYVSLDDMSRLFSNIVAGTIAVLPLNLAILVTHGAVLLSIQNKVLLTVGLILFINLFSNLVGTCCKAVARKCQQRGRIGVKRLRLFSRQTTISGVSPQCPPFFGGPERFG